MLRRFTMALIGAAVGLALLVTPASAASLSLTVYTPPMTPAGSVVTVRAKATPGAYCAISITHVLAYGYRKYANRYGAVSWSPRVPSGTPGGYHSIKVSCIKSGKRVTRYSTLVVTRTYTWEDPSVDPEYVTEWSTTNLRIPGRFVVTLEWCSAGSGSTTSGISAEWENASGSRWDYFSLMVSNRGHCYRKVEASDQGGTWGWFNVSTYSNTAGSWRMTVSGIAQ
jgi:hypothetical protein